MGPLSISFLLAHAYTEANSAPHLAATKVSFSVDRAGLAYPAFHMVGEDRPRRQSLATDLVQRVLDRYPAGTLRTVFVVKSLDLQGTVYGGTAGADGGSVILSLGNFTDIDAAWAESALHHEIAHSVMFRLGKSFPKAAWMAANSTDFRYTCGDGLAALKSGKTDLAFVGALNEQGILSSYASSSFDEDWACYAQGILSHDPAFWQLVNKYPRVRQKARMAIAFYRQVIPGIQLADVPRG